MDYSNKFLCFYYFVLLHWSIDIIVCFRLLLYTKVRVVPVGGVLALLALRYVEVRLPT